MRAPTRIDFGGGWTDVPPYADEMGGFVCNLAITRYATASVRSPTPIEAGRDADRASRGPRVRAARPADHSIADAAARRFGVDGEIIEVRSDFPIGAGLGGSSAAGVAIVAALTEARGEPMDPTAIAELSRDIEIGDLGIPGGRQDHYAAAYGGALALRFSAHGVDVRRIPLSASTCAELERRCIVVYTGQSRISGETIDAVLGAYRAREPRVLAALTGMRDNAERIAGALERGDVDAVATLVAEQWTLQRSLHPAIPTPLIDEIIERGHDAGAIGAKALGASGGGCVLLVARDDRVDAVRDVAASRGELVPFAIDTDGVTRCA
jgi:D-glycero-alpha-D-manno-heptose-7-phosphate kinase